jgi:hypothetical protein
MHTDASECVFEISVDLKGVFTMVSSTLTHNANHASLNR